MEWNNAEIASCVAEMGVDAIKRTSFRRGLALGIGLTLVGLYFYKELKPAKLEPKVKEVANG